MADLEIEEHLPAQGKRPALRMHLKHTVDPQDGYLGGAVHAHHGEHEVGYMPYGHNADNSRIQVGDMVVTKPYRRRGVASAMLDFARAKGVPVVHNTEGMTSAGQAFMRGYDAQHHTASAATDAITEIGQREHPNVEHYQSGGMGHLEGDESRSVVGFMPTHEMHRYREHGGDWNPNSDERVDKIRQDIRAGVGIKTPLMVEYNPDEHWGYLGEGNHRLRAATEEGLKTVPVRVVRSYGAPAARKQKGIGAPMHLQGQFDRDPNYTPSDIHPHHFIREAMGQAGPDYHDLTFTHSVAPPEDVEEDDDYDRQWEHHRFDAHHDGENVGHITIEHHPSEDHSGIWGLQVHPDHRRRGVARQLLDHARTHPGLGEIRHSDFLTDEGRGWADSVGGPRIAMGQAGPDYDNLTFHQMSAETYGAHPDIHHHQMLFAKHPDHGYVGHIQFEEHPDHVEIHNLSVWPDHQRRGVASQLMGELERRHPDTTIDHGVRTGHGRDWAESYYGPAATADPRPGEMGKARRTRDRQLVGARHTAAEREPLPIAKGKTFYRAHPVSRPFGPEHAVSHPLDQPEHAQRGYSSFDNPHDLERYLHAQGWVYGDSELPIKVDSPDWKIIHYQGRKVGTGVDHEHLSVPASTEHHAMDYGDFFGRLLRTPHPNVRQHWHGMDVAEHQGWGKGNGSKCNEDPYWGECGHQAGHEASRHTAVEGQHFYHVAPAWAREDIRAHGIDHRRSPHPNYAEESGERVGNWLYDREPEEGEHYLAGHEDVWRVDGAGLHPHKQWSGDIGASVVDHPIPPERLTLHRAGDPHEASRHTAAEHSELAQHVPGYPTDKVLDHSPELRHGAFELRDQYPISQLDGWEHGEHWSEHAKDDPDNAERYKRTYEAVGRGESDPIVVHEHHDEQGPYGDLLDGTHRVRYALHQGVTHLPAYVHDDQMHKQAADWHEFRRIQDSQQRRYERPGIAGSAEDKDRYFGTGEMMGHGEERQLTPKDWITHSRGQQLHDVEPEFQEHWRGHELGYAHGVAGQVDHEELEHEYGRSPHPEHFSEGYADGLESAMERVAVMQTKDRPALVALGHVSGNTIDAIHCPFCGSGSVTARSDGSIECGFCTAAYTVQVQPEYSAFPQSVDGASYPWPGRDDMGGAMPGQPVPGAEMDGDGSEEDGGGDDAPPWAQDGGDDSQSPDGDADAADDPDGGDDDDEPEASVGGKKAPPFAKKTVLHNARGTALSVEDYQRHLAIIHAQDPKAMATRIKIERQAATR